MGSNYERFIRELEQVRRDLERRAEHLQRLARAALSEGGILNHMQFRMGHYRMPPDLEGLNDDALLRLSSTDPEAWDLLIHCVAQCRRFNEAPPEHLLGWMCEVVLNERTKPKRRRGRPSEVSRDVEIVLAIRLLHDFAGLPIESSTRRSACHAVAERLKSPHLGYEAVRSIWNGRKRR